MMNNYYIKNYYYRYTLLMLFKLRTFHQKINRMLIIKNQSSLNTTLTPHKLDSRYTIYFMNDLLN